MLLLKESKHLTAAQPQWIDYDDEDMELIPVNLGFILKSRYQRPF